jgi:hypothetical protein
MDQIIFICQSLSDVADLSQGLVVYFLLTVSLCVYSWLGDELSTHVSITDHLNSGSFFMLSLLHLKDMKHLC